MARNRFHARSCLVYLSAIVTLLSVPPSISAADPQRAVVFSKQILPLLQSRCLGCHGGSAPASGYSMETPDRMLAGGRHGAAVTKGKGAQSALVRYILGDLKPKMPPDGAIDLEHVALIRRWIDEGAKVDGMIAPASPPAAAVLRSPGHAGASISPAPVTALAFSPDGALLAVGGYRSVRLLDAASGTLKQTLTGCAGQVQAVGWSSDGKLLAAAGGVPAQSGEVLIFDTTTGKPIQRLAAHTEVVYSVSWKSNTREIATGSLDKTVRIWSADSGSCERTITDHAEAVLSVAYSPDGKLLASGSADRSVKLFDTSSWKRVGTLTAHSDAVTRVVFSNSGSLLATASADRQIRVWKVEPGKMDNPLRSLGQDETINACVFSSDGSLLVSGASDHTVRVYNGDGTNHLRDMKEPVDWVYAVAVGADNKTVAAGTQDGRVYFWDGAGKLLRSEAMLPSGPVVDVK